MSSKEEYLNFCHEIWEHNRRYYVDSKPVISDFEFDLMMKKLESIEDQHPEWVVEWSPTQRVGNDLTSHFSTIKHKTPMLSLANSYSKAEVDDFIKRLEKLLEHSPFPLSAELKMDGIAISLCYEKGIFIRAVTRGNGKEGDDVTRNVRTIRNLPLKLVGTGYPDVLEVRGEVYLSRDTFQRLNEQRSADEEEPWANPRNAAAGSLKLLNPQEASRRGLQVVFYGIAEESTSGLQAQHKVHVALHQWGLPTLRLWRCCQNQEELWHFIQDVEKERPYLAFDIDGVVIKLDNLEEQGLLGATGKIPRWAVAYKFAAEQAQTLIRDITVQVGRTGVLTPVAELEPVFLAGSRISRATLHNQDEIHRKDIRIGDTVIIEKGGDVIPKVDAVVLEKRPYGSIPWNMPQQCPSCNTHVERHEGAVAVHCPNTLCPEKQLRRLCFFVSKPAMDIDNLGEKSVALLKNKGYAESFADLFRLKREQLIHLEGFKDKSADNLLSSLEKAKKPSLERFILALGIPFVGAGIAGLVAQKAKSLEEIKQMSREAFMAIEGIGDKVADALVAFFSSSEHMKEIQDLLDVGVQPQTLQDSAFEGHAFEGKTFVLTGTLEKYSRLEACQLIKERGGKITNSVSKQTDYLLVGASPGSKFEKAKKLGVCVLDEEKFDLALF